IQKRPPVQPLASRDGFILHQRNMHRGPAERGEAEAEKQLRDFAETGHGGGGWERMRATSRNATTSGLTTKLWEIENTVLLMEPEEREPIEVQEDRRDEIGWTIVLIGAGLFGGIASIACILWML